MVAIYPCDPGSTHNKSPGMQGIARDPGEEEGDAAFLARYLVGLALVKIKYVRGPFYEKYLSGDPATPSAVKPSINSIETMVTEFLEQGVYDALQKKNLMKLNITVHDILEGVISEEYTFSFHYYNSREVQVILNIGYRTKERRAIFRSSYMEVSSGSIRSSCDKMVDSLYSIMSTMDHLPNERIVQLTMIYHENFSPEVSQSPFLKDKTLNEWCNATKLEVGNGSDKHITLSVKANDTCNTHVASDCKVNVGVRMDKSIISVPVSMPEPLEWQHKSCRMLGLDSVRFPEQLKKTFFSGSIPSDCVLPKTYMGFPVYNGAIWSLNGPRNDVCARYVECNGQQRLWNILNGKILDASAILGPGKYICSTASSGTFFFTFAFAEIVNKIPVLHWCTLPIDGREGWNYGFINAHGCHEYKHPYMRYMTPEVQPLLDFSSEYNSLAQGGLQENTSMGIPSVQWACRVISSFLGGCPHSSDLPIACGILFSYGCEGFKLMEFFNMNCQSILSDSSMTVILELSRKAKKWMRTGEGSLHCILKRLEEPTGVFEPILPVQFGATTLEEAVRSISTYGFNAILRPQGQTRGRTWRCFPMDPDVQNFSVKTHYLSGQFTGRWPNEHLIREMPTENFINVPNVAPFASRFRSKTKATAEQMSPRRWVSSVAYKGTVEQLSTRRSVSSVAHIGNQKLYNLAFRIPALIRCLPK